MSWEDVAGFVFCLGGLNPLCWAGCSSPSEVEFEDEDGFPPPADHYVPPDTDAHILPDTPDTHDATTDSDSDTEDSMELPFLPDIFHPDIFHPDTGDGEDISKPETDAGMDSADTIDTEDTLQDTESKTDTPEDTDIFGDITEHTDSVEETDGTEVLCVPEKCDNEDNDCDGLVDETFSGLGEVCEIGDGICYSTGYYICSEEGDAAICDAEKIPPGIEICGDKLDNDCNGETDENCPCNVATYQPIATLCDLGECTGEGETSCVNGYVVDSCEPGEPTGPDDDCNGKDNNCDGMIDNKYVETIVTCGIGACVTTVQIKCVNGVEDTCEPGQPTFETCDGIDNDCNNSVDDGLGLGKSCTVGIGACENSGVVVCNNTGGTKCSVEPKAPTPEICDDINNDCDGTTDEGCTCVPGVYTPVDITCGIGECKNDGQTACEGGSVVDKCAPKLPAPNDASCDGKDDDCDGSIDEDYVPTQVSCGIGPCEKTIDTSCSNGVEDKSCTPKPGAPNDPTCNGVDDDCDGAADDDYMAYQITCGIGPCEKTIDTSCANGAEDNVCTPGIPTPEVCDEIDNNCDGLTDEALPDNDNDGKCNEIDCEIDGPLDKYLVLNCYSDPGITAKMSAEACWSDLTNPGTLPGEMAYIGIEYFNEGVSFNGTGIKLCVHPLWTDCDNSEPLPIACDHEIEFETKLLGTQYIWNLVSPKPDDYQAEFHFDQTKNPDVASIQIFLFMNNAGCNYLYNAFSCN